MKLVVSFYGMCLCVLEGQKGNRARRATVLLLNSAAAPRTAARVSMRPRLPYHHPLLFVPAAHADVARSTFSPVPTADALVDTDGLLRGRHYGWSLAGLDLTVGAGRGLTLHQNQDPDRETGLLRDPSSTRDAKAFLDWRRIPNLGQIVPGARLRPGFDAIGANVVGMVRVHGGELRGAAPKNVAGNAKVWRFSDSYAQVVTDRFEFHCELPGADLVAGGFAGSKPQAVRIKGAAGKTVRLAVVHEATPHDAMVHGMVRADLTARDEALPHYTAFYDALQGAAAAALPPPRPADRGVSGPAPVIENPNCPPALISLP
jgi:hypothetical protein